VTSSGKLFQTLAPAVGKTRLPTVGRRKDGTSSWLDDADQRATATPDHTRSPGLVPSYDILSGNRVCLFWDTRTRTHTYAYLTYLLQTHTWRTRHRTLRTVEIIFAVILQTVIAACRCCLLEKRGIFWCRTSVVRWEVSSVTKPRYSVAWWWIASPSGPVAPDAIHSRLINSAAADPTSITIRIFETSRTAGRSRSPIQVLTEPDVRRRFLTQFVPYAYQQP